METRNNKRMFAPIILPVFFSTGSTDIIRVYLTQIFAKMRKDQPKHRRDSIRSTILVGARDMSVRAPMESASRRLDPKETGFSDAEQPQMKYRSGGLSHQRSMVSSLKGKTTVIVRTGFIIGSSKAIAKICIIYEFAGLGIRSSFEA